MKRKLAIILSVILIFGLTLTGCSPKEPAERPTDQAQVQADTSWDDIKAKGEMVVGLDDAFPPMGFRNEQNEIIGFDIDLAKEVATRMGIKVKFQPVEWSGIIMELDSKKIDLIWNGLTITPERQEKIGFTNAYIEDKQILVVQKDSEIQNKADLADKKVALQSGSSSMDALKKDTATFESLAEVVEFTTNDEALMDLAAGRVDAVIVDEVVGRYYIAKEAEKYKVLEDNFGLEEFGVGIRKTDEAFLTELQTAIDDMKADGTAKKISEKWFGEDIIK
ncbi:MAG: amino acid ABC transporter substrate-binding protein [Eubacteriales bacterium]